jgi:hypothetical protein
MPHSFGIAEHGKPAIFGVVMPRRHSGTAIEHVAGALEANGYQFPFYLECRTIDLGPAGPVKYYYMPVSRLRDDDPERVVSNFRSCIGFWYTVTRGAGGDEERARYANYVLAICYALVNRDKGAQRIYRDALLRPRSFSPETLELPEDLRDRIRRAVASQDRDQVLLELDDALGAAQLSAEDRIVTARAMDHWVARGVFQLHTTGHEGLREWLGDVNQWTKRFRKRSQGRMRTFLDVFATECKLALNRLPPRMSFAPIVALSCGWNRKSATNNFAAHRKCDRGIGSMIRVKYRPLSDTYIYSVENSSL